jgi:hypothetical protein
MPEHEGEVGELVDRLPWPMLESQLEPGLVRIRERERRRVALRRRGLVGVAAAVVAAGALAAVGPVRGAFVNLFTFGGERVEVVDRLPVLREPASLHLGRRTSLAAARRAVPFALRLPDLDRVGRPTAVFVQGSGRDTQVALLWGREHAFSLLFTEARLSRRDLQHERLIARKRLVHAPLRIAVGSRRGLWIEGFHEYLAVSPGGERRFFRARTARNVLLWRVGRVYLRLEGRMTRREALAVARTVSG